MNALDQATINELAAVGELARAEAAFIVEQIAKWRPGLFCVVRVTPTVRIWRVSAFCSGDALRLYRDLPFTCPVTRASLFWRIVRAELRRSGYTDR